MSNQPSKFQILMAQVGATLHAWNQVESAMGLVFLATSGISNFLKAGSIFDSVISFEARIAVLDAAVTHDEKLSADEKEVWLCLSAKLRKLYKKRHEVAHFSLLSEDMRDGERILPYFTWNKHARNSTKHLTLAQLAERSAKFTAASEAVTWQSTLRRQKDLPPRANEPPTPTPQMILHIRELLARKKEA